MKALHRVCSKKTLLTAATVAVALAAGAHDAHATLTSWAVPGSICNASNPTVGVAIYNANGVFNNSGVGQLPVSCGLTTIQNAILSSNVIVRVYDRNSNEQVSCSLYTTNSTGAVSFVQTQGSGISFNSPNIQGIAFTSLGLATFGAEIECLIPTVTGSGVSHVANIIYTMSSP
jgi:hypothetical protein